MSESMTTTPSAQHRHAVRGPFNSWFLNLLDGYVDRRFGNLRDSLAQTADGASEVLEIGPGNGPILRRMPRGARVHAVEPNPHFHQRLRRAAERSGTDLVLHAQDAERIDLPDDSVDVALAAWVLCTVRDPARVLAEVRRVLRPGGTFACYEHVAAEPDSAVRRTQDAVRRPWAWVFEGCQTNRDTAASIRSAGFHSVRVQTFRPDTVFVPLRRQILAVATT